MIFNIGISSLIVLTVSENCLGIGGGAAFRALYNNNGTFAGRGLGIEGEEAFEVNESANDTFNERNIETDIECGSLLGTSHFANSGSRRSHLAPWTVSIGKIAKTFYLIKDVIHFQKDIMRIMNTNTIALEVF